MPTTTIQPASADTMIINVTPTTNYGTNAVIAIGDSSGAASAAYRTLVKFDVSSIPPNARITAATLALNEYSAFDTAGVGSWSALVYGVLKDWVEAQATWNVYSTGNSWAVAGLGAGDVTVALDSITLDGTAAAGFVEWSGQGIVDAVQAWVDGTVSNYGFVIIAPAAESQGTTPLAANLFRSKDYGTAGDRPKLTVTYDFSAALVNDGGLVNGGPINRGLVR